MLTEILKLPGVNSDIYRLKPLWKENSFEITLLLENSTAWHGDITEIQLAKLAKDRAQTVNDYYDTIKKCVIKPEADFTFDVKQSKSAEETCEFLIKRKVGGRTILFFDIKLSKLDFQQCTVNLIDELVENNIALHQEFKKSEEKQIALVEEKKVYVDKLAEFVELKGNWEQEMYSNFLIILNEKKKRIKFLTDILTHKNINPDEMPIPETSKASLSRSSSPVQARRLEILSDSGTNSEYETDKENDDMEIEDDPTPKPSTSKHALDLDDDTPQPVLRLPKLIKPSQEVFFAKKIKENMNATANILTEETQEILTQEPYLSTQDRIDRM